MVQEGEVRPPQQKNMFLYKDILEEGKNIESLETMEVEGTSQN
jgi:hypothetical protein